MNDSHKSKMQIFIFPKSMYTIQSIFLWSSTQILLKTLSQLLTTWQYAQKYHDAHSKLLRSMVGKVRRNKAINKEWKKDVCLEEIQNN